MPNEIWKDIVGFEGKYQVSNLGNVKSLNYENYKKGSQILKLRKRKDDYLQVGLYKNNKEKKYLVHRLVAITFITNIKNLKVVNHKNGIKNDNRVENLEWCTQSQNMMHSYKNNLHKKYFGKNHHNSKSVIQYDMNGNFIKKWETITQAQKETNSKHISECCIGKRKSANNYIWRYE